MRHRCAPLVPGFSGASDGATWRRILLLVLQDLLLSDAAVCPEGVRIPDAAAVEGALATFIAAIEQRRRDAKATSLPEDERYLVSELTDALRGAWAESFRAAVPPPTSLAPFDVAPAGGPHEASGSRWGRGYGMDNARVFALTRQLAARVEEAVARAATLMSQARAAVEVPPRDLDAAARSLARARKAVFHLLEQVHLSDRALGGGSVSEGQTGALVAATAAVAALGTSDAVERAERAEREIARREFAYGQALAAARLEAAAGRSRLVEAVTMCLEEAGAAGNGAGVEALAARVRTALGEGEAGEGEKHAAPRAFDRRASATGMRGEQEAQIRELQGRLESSQARCAALEEQLARQDREVADGLDMLQARFQRELQFVVDSAGRRVKEEKARRRLAVAGAHVLAARAVAEFSRLREAADTAEERAGSILALRVTEALEEAIATVEGAAARETDRLVAEVTSQCADGWRSAVAAAVEDTARRASQDAASAAAECLAEFAEEAGEMAASMCAAVEHRAATLAAGAEAAGLRREAQLREAFREVFADKFRKLKSQHACRIAQVREQAMRRAPYASRAGAQRAGRASSGGGAPTSAGASAEARLRQLRAEARREREEAVAECEARYLEKLRATRAEMMERGERHARAVQQLQRRVAELERGRGAEPQPRTVP